ncbi:hypothetical protein JG688_00017663 [Phytophthora aleatoria]|uniref:Uncharacterized protein n=1 Tax=Phytophthora aleatoria TaxID=2496075 RepID=A0A8J5IH36_9STRA|nr:hypothetical protein JG688_00017663 [Phytophthora aleatoria]
MEKGVSDIKPVLDTVRLKRHSNVNESSNANSPPPKFGSKTSQVAFVRPKLSERSTHSVLTHAEKYHIARPLFEPVIDRHTRLSSAKFYRQIRTGRLRLHWLLMLNK